MVELENVNLGVYIIYNPRALGYSALTVAKQGLTALNKKQGIYIKIKNKGCTGNRSPVNSQSYSVFTTLYVLYICSKVRS